MSSGGCRNIIVRTIFLRTGATSYRSLGRPISDNWGQL